LFEVSFKVVKMDREERELVRDDDRERGPSQTMIIPINPGEEVKKKRRLSEEETTKKEGKKTKKLAEREKELKKKSLFVGDEHKVVSSESFSNKVKFTEVTKRERKPKEVLEEEKRKKKEEKREKEEEEKRRKKEKKAEKMKQLDPDFVRSISEPDTDTQKNSASNQLKRYKSRTLLQNHATPFGSGPVRTKSWEQRLGEIDQELCGGGDQQYREYMSDTGERDISVRDKIAAILLNGRASEKPEREAETDSSTGDDQYSVAETVSELGIIEEVDEQSRPPSPSGKEGRYSSRTKYEDTFSIPVIHLSNTKVTWRRTIDQYLGFMGVKKDKTMGMYKFEKEFSFSAFGNSIHVAVKGKGETLEFKGGIAFYFPLVDVEERNVDYQQEIDIIEHNTCATISSHEVVQLKPGMFLNAECGDLYLYAFGLGDELFNQICERMDERNSSSFIPKCDQKRLMKTFYTFSK
jgi:hypothetical protein